MEAPRQIEVREARPEDAEAMRAIVTASPEAGQWIDAANVLVAVRESELLGFLAYRIVLGEGEILNLAVAPGSRRQGISSRLLQSVLPLAAEWFLEVRVSNATAQAAYRRLAFREIGRRPRYYSDGEDALLYCWP